MHNFTLHDLATELSSSKSAYKLARELLELQEQYIIAQQKIAGYTEMLEQLLKVNKILTDEVVAWKEQQKGECTATDWKVQYELEC